MLSLFRAINRAAGYAEAILADVELAQHCKRIQRYQIAHGITAPPRDRLPLTLPMIERMAARVNVKSAFEVLVILFCLLGVYGLFCSGELTETPGNPYNVNLHIARKHVTFHATHATVSLPTSKTDTAGKHTIVAIPRIEGHPLCPVRWLQHWIRVRTPHLSPNAPLLSMTGSRLDKQDAVRGTRMLLKRAGYNPKLYAGHSLRIGGATMLKAAGASTDTVKTLGVHPPSQARPPASAHARFPHCCARTHRPRYIERHKRRYHAHTRRPLDLERIRGLRPPLSKRARGHASHAGADEAGA